MGHGAPDNSAAAKPLWISPRRGRLRKRYVALLIVLLAIGWVGWKGYVIVSAKPGPLVDYTPQLIALSEKYQPKGENGWPALVAALEHFRASRVPDIERWPTDEREAADIMRLSAVSVGSFDRERLRYELAYLDHVARSGVLEELDAALAAPCFMRTEFPGADECLMWMELRELAAARELSRARAAALRVCAEAGNWQELERAWGHLIKTASAFSHDPLMLSHLLSQAITVLAVEELDRLLVEYQFDERVCRDLLQALETDANLAPLELAIEGERLIMYDTIQHTFTDDGHGDGVLVVGNLARFADVESTYLTSQSELKPLSALPGLMFAGRADTKRALDQYMDAAVRASRSSRGQVASDPESFSKIYENLPREQVFLTLMMPVLNRPLDLIYLARAKIAATRLLLAIEAYQARLGTLPRSLEDLVPEFLPWIPLDETSGRPFVYVSREPSSEDSREFLLYSVGVDGVDNGGGEVRNVDALQVLLTQTEPELRDGFDYIFNRLREPVEEEQK